MERKVLIYNYANQLMINALLNAKFASLSMDAWNVRKDIKNRVGNASKKLMFISNWKLKLRVLINKG